MYYHHKWCYYHVIGVCLHGQSASRKNNQGRKAHIPWCTFSISKKSDCHPCFMIIKSILLHFVSSRINKPFTCSCCLISISCSAHTMSTYYTVCAKDHRFFIIITRKSTRSEDPTTWWFCIVSLLWPDNSRSPNWSILVAYSDIQITFASKFCFNLHWIFSWMSAF